MPYTIRFSDPIKTQTITVPDNPPGLNSVDTSLKLIGRNYPNFGQVIAENFLHSLENFASATEPTNPTEGQLWFRNVDGQKKLYVYDGATWGPTNGVHQMANDPTTPGLYPQVTVNPGDIWIDPDSQLMYIRNNIAEWILIGGSFSASSRNGAYPTTLTDTLGNEYNVVIMYINDNAIEIIANAAFTPAGVIEGFTGGLKPGINITSKTFSGQAPVVSGAATSALALKQTSPSNEIVSANNFIRNDIDQRTNGVLTINNDSGMRIGRTSSTFSIQRSGDQGVFLNQYNKGSFRFQIDNSDGVPRPTLLAIDGNTQRIGIGINNIQPQATLDVLGDIVVSRINSTTGGTLRVKSTQSNAVQFDGGLAVSGPTIISNSFQQSGITKGAVFEGTVTIGIAGDVNYPSGIVPAVGNHYDIGSDSLKFRRIYANVIGSSGTSLVGTLQGTVNKLTSPTQFKITGTVQATTVPTFDGLTGGFVKEFNMTVTNAFVTSQVIAVNVTENDGMIIYSNTATQIQQTVKSKFLSSLYGPYYGPNSPDYNEPTYFPEPQWGGDEIIPPGTIWLWAWPTTPTGWHACDGTSAGTTSGPNSRLFNIIGSTYGYTSATDEFYYPKLSPVINVWNPVIGSTATQINYIIKL